MTIRKSAADRKAEIIDATLQLADELGPERLTTEAVAKAVGITQPGIFRHFPKKQDLWDAVAARIGRTMEARWAREIDPDAPPLDRICAIVTAQLRLIQSTPAIPAILFSRELHSRNKGLRKAFFALLKRFHGTIATLAAEAKETGAIRKDVNPEDIAFLTVALVQGLAVRWSISERRFDLPGEGARLLKVQLGAFAESGYQKGPNK